MNGLVMLKATEVIKAMDVTLLKVNCPRCGAENLVGAEIADLECSDCQNKTCVSAIDYESANRRNLVSWGSGNKRGRIGKKIVRELFNMQEGFCAYCDCVLGNYHVDHITPLSFGGSNSISNLALSCPECNLTAHSKVFPSYMAKKIFIVDARAKEVAKT